MGHDRVAGAGVMAALTLGGGVLSAPLLVTAITTVIGVEITLDVRQRIVARWSLKEGRLDRRHVGFAITLFRGVLAVGLGVALFFQPDKARPVLGNFMGMYWLAGGLISLRWGVGGRRAKGVWLAAGLIGVLAGAAMLGRSAARSFVPDEAFSVTLGAIIVLTGLLHIFGGFRTGEPLSRERSVASLLLGIFEVVLGLLLMITNLEFGPPLYLAASIWALLGGAILIGDALRVRRRQDKGEEGNA